MTLATEILQSSLDSSQPGPAGSSSQNPHAAAPPVSPVRTEKAVKSEFNEDETENQPAELNIDPGLQPPADFGEKNDIIRAKACFQIANEPILLNQDPLRICFSLLLNQHSREGPRMKLELFSMEHQKRIGHTCWDVGGLVPESNAWQVVSHQLGTFTNRKNMLGGQPDEIKQAFANDISDVFVLSLKVNQPRAQGCEDLRALPELQDTFRRLFVKRAGPISKHKLSIQIWFLPPCGAAEFEANCVPALDKSFLDRANGALGQHGSASN